MVTGPRKTRFTTKQEVADYHRLANPESSYFTIGSARNRQLEQILARVNTIEENAEYDAERDRIWEAKETRRLLAELAALDAYEDEPSHGVWWVDDEDMDTEPDDDDYLSDLEEDEDMEDWRVDTNDVDDGDFVDHRLILGSLYGGRFLRSQNWAA